MFVIFNVSFQSDSVDFESNLDVDNLLGDVLSYFLLQ